VGVSWQVAARNPQTQGWDSHVEAIILEPRQLIYAPNKYLFFAFANFLREL